jgi:hypothetical protein
MLDVVGLLKEARGPLAHGNLILPLREFLAALATASRGGKRILYAEIRQLLSLLGPEITEAERRWVRERLEQYREEPPFEVERRELLSRLEERVPSSTPARPGRANILFVAGDLFRGQRVGVVHALDILGEPWGGRVRLRHPADIEADVQGFQQGVWAAQQYLSRRGLGTRSGALLRLNYTLEGVLPRLPPGLPLSGPSIGLGTAVAVVSRLLDMALPSHVAFTGHVDPTGQIQPVAGIAPKLEAAADKGLAEVYLPAANLREVPPTASSRVAAKAAFSLDGVAEQLFGTSCLEDAVNRLRAALEPQPLQIGDQSWLVAEDRPEGRLRIVLTCVGRADPFGRYLDRDRTPVAPQVEEEGPILTICRVLSPQVVYLFYTTHKPDNDFRGKAEEVDRLIKQASPDCRVVHVPLVTLTDPSDYGQLWPAFRPAVEKIIRSETSGDPSFYVNLSSGSPQMETTWHWLVGAKVLRARLLQVREGRFVPEGETRVRPVSLPWVE